MFNYSYILNISYPHRIMRPSPPMTAVIYVNAETARMSTNHLRSTSVKIQKQCNKYLARV